MKKTKIIQNTVEILYILLMINYMIGVIIFHDNIMQKYLRDILLIILFIIVLKNGKIKFPRESIFALIFLGCSIIGILNATSLKTGIIAFRRYAFPLLFLLIVYNLNVVRDFNKFLKFLLCFTSLLSLWGIFQAQILGDSFLRKLGYPLVYSYAYKRDMLYNSFYFGGLGIQRVVSTFSSSNIYALVTGIALIFLIICYEYINVKYKDILLFIISLGYMLSFSRSNILAILIVMLLFLRKYIPHKKKLLLLSLIAVLMLVIIGIIQGENGIIFRFYGWIKSSLNFTDSSAAGRYGIWQTALYQIMKSPLGIGYGHVGALVNETIDSVVKYSAENSYFVIALDMGWIGLFLYVAFLITILIELRRKYKMSCKEGDIFGGRICYASYVIVIYLMIVMCFSNHIQDMEIIAAVYLYVGISGYYINNRKSNPYELKIPDKSMKKNECIE